MSSNNGDPQIYWGGATGNNSAPSGRHAPVYNYFSAPSNLFFPQMPGNYKMDISVNYNSGPFGQGHQNPSGSQVVPALRSPPPLYTPVTIGPRSPAIGSGQPQTAPMNPVVLLSKKDAVRKSSKF